MFQWKNEYVTGIDFIDEQHKMLFEIAYKAYDIYKNDMILDKYDKIVEVIEELKEYTKYHFGEEEKFMLENKYKKFFSHKIQHDDLINDLDKMNLKDMDHNQDKALLDILNFVLEWIQNHILKTDLGMTAEIKKSLS